MPIAYCEVAISPEHLYHIYCDEGDEALVFARHNFCFYSLQIFSYHELVFSVLYLCSSICFVPASILSHLKAYQAFFLFGIFISSSSTILFAAHIPSWR